MSEEVMTVSADVTENSSTENLSGENSSAQTITTEETKSKRGRKAKNKIYFGEVQEKAVVDYIQTDDVDKKEKIYYHILKPAFKTMLESIIRRYRLRPPDETFEECFEDTLSFLMTKLSYFDPEKGRKAYSYCGTICKNYLLLKMTKFYKAQERILSYDNPEDTILATVANDLEFSDINQLERPKDVAEELTARTVNKIETLVKDPENKFSLTDTEKKVGEAINYIFRNWEELFDDMGSNKFNRSSILLHIEDLTGLPAKEIRKAMTLYKDIYYDEKIDLLNE